MSRMAMGMLLSPMIESDSKNDDGSRNDLLHPVRQPPLRGTELNHGHDGGAKQCAEYRTPSAEQTASADDDCGNHVQLETGSNSWIADRQLRELHHSSKTGEAGADRVNRQFAGIDAHAAKPRCSL